MNSTDMRRLMVSATVTASAVLIAIGPAQAADTPEQVTLPFTDITNPQSIAVDETGNTLVINGTDRGNDRVQRLAPDGTQTALPFTWLGGPVEVTVEGSTTTIRGTSQLPGLDIDRSGNTTVVVNCGTGSGCENPIGYKVVRLSLDGAQTTLPFTDIGGPVTQPLDVAVDTSGNTTLTVTGVTPKVVRLSPDGTQTTLPFTGLVQPYGVAVDQAGNTTVVDTGSNRVVRLGPDGTQSILPFSGLRGPTHVAVDSTGQTTVTDSNNNRVVRLSPDGTQSVLPFIGLNGPTGIAVDRAGNTVVADSRNNRVVRLSPNVTPAPTPGFPGFGS